MMRAREMRAGPASCLLVVALTGQGSPQAAPILSGATLSMLNGGYNINKYVLRFGFGLMQTSKACCI